MINHLHSRVVIAIAVGALAAMMTATGAAHADSADDGFLNNVRSVDNAGLATLVDAAPDVVTATGRSVCTMLDDGYGSQAVKGMVLDRLAMYGEARGYNAGLVGVFAVRAYCPAHQADSGFNENY
jgi:hypothetical protein